MSFSCHRFTNLAAFSRSGSEDPSQAERKETPFWTWVDLANQVKKIEVRDITNSLLIIFSTGVG
jgi:hypothetical protein